VAHSQIEWRNTSSPIASCRKALIWEDRSIPGRSFASLSLRYINAKQAAPMKIWTQICSRLDRGSLLRDQRTRCRRAE
jgi:hypothetical protein